MPSGSKRHNWNSWQGYLDAHQSYLRSREHFLVEDRLPRPEVTDQTVVWNGALILSGGYEVHVTRHQAVQVRRGVPWVKTIQYSYQAVHRDGNGRARELFRYDNVHRHQGHRTAHHRHAFDAAGHELPSSPVCTGDDWPTLGEVIDEIYDCWRRHC